MAVEIIEKIDDWRRHFADWRKGSNAADSEINESYPFVKNRRAPFTPARRALSMVNLALISSAGAYIDGTDPFNTAAAEGDLNFREIPAEIEAGDLRFAARGYDPQAVEQDINSQLPLARLFEFEANGIIGQLNPVFWSFCGYISNAARLVEEMLPHLVERVLRYEVQAALLIPASQLCHQSVSLAARAIEEARIPTMTVGVDKAVLEMVRPPRGAFYAGRLGRVAGEPNWPEHQRRILDESLRLIEPMDQAGTHKLVVELESMVEKERGEK